ncbi:hypothetical protein AAVH_23291, partial [Aphelenchoides avenae]
EGAAECRERRGSSNRGRLAVDETRDFVRDTGGRDDDDDGEGDEVAAMRQCSGAGEAGGSGTRKELKGNKG